MVEEMGIAMVFQSVRLGEKKVVEMDSLMVTTSDERRVVEMVVWLVESMEH